MNVPASAYGIAASYFHWMVAVPLVGCVGSVLKCQQVPKNEKEMWMWRHKSLGLLTGMIVAPRVAFRLFSKQSVGVVILERCYLFSALKHVLREGMAETQHSSCP